MNDCARNLKSLHNCRYGADLDLFVSRYRVGFMALTLRVMKRIPAACTTFS